MAVEIDGLLAEQVVVHLGRGAGRISVGGDEFGVGSLEA